jgi:LuxR family maltose regulon positive regulatory protein
MNDTQAAFRDLEAAWELAKNNELFMPFAERGKDMRALAGAAIRAGSLSIPKDVLEKIQRSSALYAKNLLAVSVKLESRTQAGPGRRGSGKLLSPREIDILTGLSQGLTREETARVRSLSINTVKSITRSIFFKLGAVNRADAIRIATELGLL